MDPSRWKKLLTWLNTHGMDTSPENMLVEARVRPGAGYGLFAQKQVKPSTPLFTIPASALLNNSTLSSHYPKSRPSLTATQLISLHMFLHRPIGSQDSSDPLFGPYLSVLPREFDSHPLTWLCDKHAHSTGTELLSCLPPSVMHSLSKLADRLHADWKAVCGYLKENLSILPPLRNFESTFFQSQNPELEPDYLWAWLSVNTRCIYHRLKNSASDSDNLTLCPILDFANHTTKSTHMLPHESHGGSTGYRPPNKTSTGYTLLSPADSVTQCDDELHLTYGAHANRTLFVEYGFVNEVSQQILLRGDIQGEVDVQTPVERLLEARGTLGAWMEGVLKDEGYWGDWTLHLLPIPAHPSYRLITALRLYHLFPMSTKVPPLYDDILEPWKDTLLGEKDIVSDENESAWRETLLEICQSIAKDATSMIAKCGNFSRWEAEWLPAMKSSVKMLWEEELHVAQAVSESIRANEKF